ncbi:MAG: sulfotransferase [Magnetococcales bacterium]|nr:sulfotransferase [Magnetococcales bacterium]
MANNKRVDFIGIGAGKCGSTWIYDNLVKHPKICNRNLKELNYFSDLFEEHPPQWYDSQFKSCASGLLKGEFSVTYLPHPQAAERIKKHLPDIKLIAIFRDPVKRTFSNYLHSLRKGDIASSLTFSEYVNSEENLASSRYADLLAPFVANFKREQILVVILEKFTQDIRDGYRRTFSFLEVEEPEFFLPEFEARRNVARSYRFMKLENFLVQTYRWLCRSGYTRFVKAFIDMGLAQLFRSINSVDRPLPVMDEDSRQKLTTYFKPFNQELSVMIDEDLSCWDHQD